jgi:cytochrome oxidase Cu insertion factor (SCO1/SenC/PrrC family)
MAPRRASWPARPAVGIALVLSVLLVAAAAGGATLEELLFDLRLVPQDGATPAAFTLDDLEGGRVSLSDFKGRVVLLYFWAGW